MVLDAFSLVRVMDKQLDSERPQYLVLGCMYPQEGEAVNSKFECHFREYDEKVSRDLAQQERLSTLRSWNHFPTDHRQNPDRARKRRRTGASERNLQNYTHPSRQVEENLFLDSDVRSVVLEPIQATNSLRHFATLPFSTRQTR